VEDERAGAAREVQLASEPDGLVRVYQANPKQGLRQARISLADFEDWRTQLESIR
jgi:hypothetical protein